MLRTKLICCSDFSKSLCTIFTQVPQILTPWKVNACALICCLQLGQWVTLVSNFISVII